MAKLSEVLLDLNNQICRLGNPLYIAFENIGREREGVWSQFLKDCGEIIKNQHEDPGEAWITALEKNKSSIPLDESDWKGISELGHMLGKSDRFTQGLVIERAKETIGLLELEAREAVKTKSRLYKNMGALGGAALVILLI